MTEELVDGSAFARMSPSRQQELIGSHCADIEHQIASAASVEEASALVENACVGFDRECTSKLLATALSEHVRMLLRKYWDSPDEVSR